jgi:hypothetical protein
MRDDDFEMTCKKSLNRIAMDLGAGLAAEDDIELRARLMDYFYDRLEHSLAFHLRTNANAEAILN